MPAVKAQSVCSGCEWTDQEVGGRSSWPSSLEEPDKKLFLSQETAQIRSKYTRVKVRGMMLENKSRVLLKELSLGLKTGN